jgi:serine-type D-Ala-D-Ala carboxypeptidase/endopeptidase (penicillin-binding protein 4)
VGGRDGTLRGRFTQGPGRGAVLAKTGTVTGARNLAGYVTTAGGTPVAFALLANQFGTSTARVTQAQDAIVETLIRYRR